MKVQEVILKAMAGSLKWWEAAEIIGVTDRTMRRWRERYEKDGYDGLYDYRKQQPSPKRIAVKTLEEVLQLYREKYFDFNVRHFHEKLSEEHSIDLSYTWVKLALQGAGLVAKKNKKYRLTSLGRVVYGLQITTQNALNNYWKLRAIDSLDDISEQELEQVIENMIGDQNLRELLAKKYSDIAISNVLEGSSCIHQQAEERNHGNLMLVEDDSDVLFAFKTILISEGYNVDAFTDSFEALKHFIKLNRPYYDLVLLDIRMRGMNGIQLCQKLKCIDNDLRVIFVSALDAAEELASILPDLNPPYIIRKPISANDFVKVVKKAVRFTKRLQSPIAMPGTSPS